MHYITHCVVIHPTTNHFQPLLSLIEVEVEHRTTAAAIRELREHTYNTVPEAVSVCASQNENATPMKCINIAAYDCNLPLLIKCLMHRHITIASSTGQTSE